MGWFDPFEGKERVSAWVHVPGLALYIRRTSRWINGEMRPTLEIGSVDADDPGKGAFTAFLTEFEAKADDLDVVVYIENVLAPRFARFWERRGYLRHREQPADYCYWRSCEGRNRRGAGLSGSVAGSGLRPASREETP